MTHFREIRWANDRRHIASRFHDTNDHGALAEGLAGALLEVDYEETVADLEGVARRLVAWCGLEWEPNAWSSTGRSRRSERPAWSRCGSRSSAPRWEDGSTTNSALAPLFARLETVVAGSRVAR